MSSLAEASLGGNELALIEHFVEKLRTHLGEQLRGVWLFGSRARGEEPTEDSDVDLLVLVDDASWNERMWVRRVLDDSAQELEMSGLAWSFSVHVHTLEWLNERREIRSFFIAELDRDKVVLCGTA